MNVQIFAAPVTRIAVRYLAGGLIGQAGAAALLADPDLMTLATALIGAALAAGAEWLYRRAKRAGGAT